MDRTDSNAEYYQKNRDFILEKCKIRQADYYTDEEKRAIIRNQQKVYYQKNREILLKRARERRQQNLEQP